MPSIVARPELGRTKPAEHPHGRRLAGAVRAQEPEDLAPLDLEREIAHGHEVAVGFGEAGNGNDGITHFKKNAAARILPVSPYGKRRPFQEVTLQSGLTPRSFAQD